MESRQGEADHADLFSVVPLVELAQREKLKVQEGESLKIQRPPDRIYAEVTGKPAKIELASLVPYTFAPPHCMFASLMLRRNNPPQSFASLRS